MFAGHPLDFWEYPLTRNYYEKNTLKIIFRNSGPNLPSQNFPGKRNICQELRVEIRNLGITNYSEKCFVSHNLVSEGCFFSKPQSLDEERRRRDSKAPQGDSCTCRSEAQWGGAVGSGDTGFLWSWRAGAFRFSPFWISFDVGDDDDGGVSVQRKGSLRGPRGRTPSASRRKTKSLVIDVC